MITKKPIQLREIEGMYGKYEVMENIEYYNGLVVPKSFITDLASIPKLFQGVIGKPNEEEFIAPSILHDYLYSKYNEYGINKQTADKIFLQSLLMNGVESTKARLMYKGVKVGGEFCFVEEKVNGKVYKQQALIDHTPEHKEYQNRMKELLGKWYV